jgi:multidrug efflux system membrane fusion protein
MNLHTIPTLMLIPLLGLALLAGACGKRAGGPPPRPPAAVVLATAAHTNAPVVITAYGSLLDRESVDIVPQVSGILMEILVQEGAVVTNGQPLFRIDARDYQIKVRQAEGLVAATAASLAQARSTLQRNQPLLEKALIAPDAFDALRTKVTTLEAQLRVEDAALEQARLNLARCTIVAPLAGVCSKRYLDAGNLAMAGMTRLINIRSYDPLRLECSVSEQHLAAIRAALADGPIAVTVSPRGEGRPYPGTVTFVDNAVNALAGTILLRGEVPNPEHRLWANQFVDAHLTLGSIPDAVMVPESAVQFGKQGPYLYVAGQDRKVSLRPVKTGIRVNDWVQIVAGVAAGETVVTLGQMTLYPGAVVADASQAPATAPH